MASPLKVARFQIEEAKEHRSPEHLIISRTPFRISFFGGGTDYPGWYKEHGGAVLSTTIDKYCYISCRRLPPFFDYKHRVVYSQIETVKDPTEIKHPAVRAVLGTMGVQDGLEIHHDADLPARSGLGSSSSFTVGMINALMAYRGQYISKHDLASMAVHIEQNVIAENVGSQDQVAAAYGGFNRVEFQRDGSFTVTPMIMLKERRDQLQGSLMLFFTGFQREASKIAEVQLKNMKARQSELKTMRDLVNESTSLLQARGDIGDDFGKLLHESWKLKRSLSDKVTNPELDKIYEAGIAAGATGGKLLGAGGGGFMLFYVKPELQKQVREKLSPLLHVSFKFEGNGSKIIVYDAND